ncbi:tetratricopeptide repeat protein [Desertivirga arenae]|uniref:tetratricopeptide repeat protein n=1 Tax=Desertivirga arenae TaxID=2810309 RepID=UPI001F61414D|nr:tetratricopeptide repeat protein [Pedobacter sp. SYSU D00823]
MFLILLCFQAKASFDFNPQCLKAYKEIYALRLNNARNLIETEKKKNPQNAIPYLLDNYVDYFTIITTENKAEFEKLKNSKSSRLNRIEKDDKTSPYYLFAQAEIHMQWALTYGYFQEYLSSSMELKKAYSLLQENGKKFPSFLPNQKNIGMLNAVLGALPSGLKKTISVFGMRGNTETGVKMLENLVRTLPNSAYSHFYDDAVFCLAYVQSGILNDRNAFPKIVANVQRIDSSSLLKSYILSYSAIRTGRTNEAIRVLESRPKGAEYQPYSYLDYLAGTAHLRKLDLSSFNYFTTYLRSYRGINYIKDTYLNLAWISLLKGNTAGYKEYIQLVKTKGYTFHEKDKQALQEANDPMPHADLLKARLLFDGGFYDRALNELKDKKAGDFNLLRDKIEFCYRLGRIYDETGREDLAIKFYQFAVDIGKKERYYFASNAAYRIGSIYAQKKNYQKARDYYSQAIDMEDHDYERSVEAKAKEALSRLND